ncbi:MAG: UDP-N-acetylmuramoyl-L-alanyl-D-glutamate--2,6-diaminopimelate ligase [Myxococcota bacterium]
MRLGELLEAAGSARGGDLEQDAVSLTADSRKVRPGSVFVAVPGLVTDGHHFIAEALGRGAVAIVGQKPGGVPPGVAAVEVEDSRIALGLLAARFHGDPSREMLIVGVTGTNGKTTTAYLIESMLAEAGWRVGVIGTVAYRWGGESYPAPLTTPDSPALQATLRRMRDAGCDAAVIEISSHALALRRLAGCDVDLGVFTNLTQDHLDYHGSMERYFEAKARLFSEHLAQPEVKRPRRAVVNTDDPRAVDLIARTPCDAVTFAVRAEARVTAWEVKLGLGGIRAEVVTPAGGFGLHSPLLGMHNLSNLLAAVSVGIALDVPLERIRRGLAAMNRVPGRMDRAGGPADPHVFIDYAHTPDALDRVLGAAADLAEGGLIAVFGCGGDRDTAKRPLMGEAAARHAQLAIVTSDNPRTEDPRAIIEDVLAGVRRAGGKRYETGDLAELPAERGYVVLPDRREAIRLACALAGGNRIVVIAGKGHEDYQIVGDRRLPFDDREEAMIALGATRTVK